MRKALTQKTRFEVFKRDSFTCIYCGGKPPTIILEVDHIIPVAKKGTNDIDNLATSCFSCNRGKSANELTSIPLTVEEKLKISKEKEKQYKEYKSHHLSIDKRLNNEVLMVEDIYRTHHNGWEFNEHFKITVKKFIQRIGIIECINRMEYSCAKFNYDEDISLKYFCGMCWGFIRDNEL